MRPEAKSRLKGSPEESLRRLYYDTIVHAPRALEFLIEQAGPGQVLLGSDYPFDMGTLECARQVKALAIPQGDRDTILGGGAAALLQE